jgi:hypothetical protein
VTLMEGFGQSIPVIAFGTILGHGLCTFMAVMGGRYLSTKISVKHSKCRRHDHNCGIDKRHSHADWCRCIPNLRHSLCH